jgi:transcriptional antiterminator Rof (Rho-off)
MTDSPYHPIACGLHETYQLAAIKGVEVDLTWSLEDGSERQCRVKVEDVFTRSQAEYLKANTQAGERLEIRLDLIRSAHWAASGEPLGG